MLRNKIELLKSQKNYFQIQTSIRLSFNNAIAIIMRHVTLH